MLMVAMRKNILIIILMTIVMIIPLINLILLLFVNNEATTMLRTKGAKVGFFGVSPDEYPKLHKGNCMGCGYDRSGLELLAPCPECGRIPEVR